ncbi:MAG: hypothetical protein KKE93_02930 [Nanoarchaeota archaeon]|nr:hypothetical protein [Nanoarchaeota archaeon]
MVNLKRVLRSGEYFVIGIGKYIESSPLSTTLNIMTPTTSVIIQSAEGINSGIKQFRKCKKLEYRGCKARNKKELNEVEVRYEEASCGNGKRVRDFC